MITLIVLLLIAVMIIAMLLYVIYDVKKIKNQETRYITNILQYYRRNDEHRERNENADKE